MPLAGSGGGLVAFAGGKLEPGIKLVIEAVKLEERLEERRPVLDRRRGHRRPERLRQDGRRSRRGSLDHSIVPYLALAGSIGPGAEAVLEHGIDAYFSICPGPIGLDQAIAQAGVLLEARDRAGCQRISGGSPPAVRSRVTFRFPRSS